MFTDFKDNKMNSEQAYILHQIRIDNKNGYLDKNGDLTDRCKKSSLYAGWIDGYDNKEINRRDLKKKFKGENYNTYLINYGYGSLTRKSYSRIINEKREEFDTFF